MKTVMGNLRFWVGGVAIASLGVVLARVISPTFSGSAQVVVILIGQSVAVLGLVLICWGVSRRVWRERREGKQS